jgi:FKBP-type peptidyl-prolyl cis-trans isomerase
MKKSIVSAALMLSVCAGFAFSQTRKPVVRRKKTTVVRKVGSAEKTGNRKKTARGHDRFGLTYIITQNGSGARLKSGDTVTVHYTGF